MNTLVIYTHPNHHSLNYGLLETVTETLSKNNQKFEVLDLYQEAFDPVLVFNKEVKRSEMYKDPYMSPYRDAIKRADRIILIYPIFWGRPPAMLLGFIDRLFASNFAYQDNGGLLPTGLLKGKEAIVISTMKGPKHYLRFWLNNAHQVLMRRALFSFVGINKVKFFEFGGIEGKTPTELKNRNKAFQKIRAYFS